MKKLLHYLVAVILPLVFAVAANAAESPSVLLQKGIYAEETEGNLDSAIKIYQQIATEAAANRSVVTQAQYRLALCFQKKGDKAQAITLLNGLVQSSADDASMGMKVREALSALGETPSTALSVRKIPLPIASRAFYGLSADGRYLPYESMLPALDVMVCDISTGRSWTIFKGVKGKEEPWTEAIISPDGQQIAFDVSGDFSTANAIYIAKLDGSERRKIYAIDEKKNDVYLMGWAPDGGRLIVNWWDGPTGVRSIAALDVKTGAKSEIRRMTSTANGERPDKWTLSPSAQYLAVQKRNYQYPRTITVLDLKSGREGTVIEKDAERVVGWALGESKLVYSKNGPNGLDLWAVAIKEGEPLGAPERIWNNFEQNPNAHVGPDGKIYYSTRKSAHDPYELWVMEGLLTKKAVGAQTESSRIQTDIPSDEMILGSDNSLLDRKFGFGATLPIGWTIRSAVRQGNGGTVVQFTSAEIREAKASPRIIHWPTTPWENPGSAVNDFAVAGPKPTTPAEIDAWLRKRLLGRLEANAKETNGDNMTRVQSSVSRVINAHHALTVTGTYTQNGESWNQIITLVYSDNLIATCQLRVPAEKFDAIRPSFERLAETIRLP